MDKKALINLGLSGLVAFLTGFAATYQLGGGDLKAALTAGGSAALAGLVNHLRQSPTA